MPNKIFRGTRFYPHPKPQYRTYHRNIIVSMSFALIEQEHTTLQDQCKDFDNFAKQWLGYEKRDETYSRYGRWRNPNSKWDWYELGGRWQMMLQLRGRTKLFPGVGKGKLPHREFCDEDYYDQLALKHAAGTHCDMACNGLIDWESTGFNLETYNRNKRFWELYVDGQTPQNEEEEKMVEREFYKKSYYKNHFGDAETFARRRAMFTTHAVVKDGEWCEVGEMGWWGVSSESGQEEIDWANNYYDNFIKDLPDEALVAVVDCHI